MKAMRFLCLSLLVVGLAWSAQAEQLVVYGFTDSTPAPTAAHAFVDASNFSISAGSITYGSAQSATWTGSGVPYAQGVGGWAAEDFEGAKYWEFTLGAVGDATFSITNISFLYRQTAALEDITTAYSINGTQINTVPYAGSNTTGSYADAIAGYDDITNVVIRIHGWGATSTAGDFRLDDVRIEGTVDIPAGDFPPVVANPSVDDITPFSAMLGGEVTFDGFLPISKRGVYYSETQGFTPPGQGTKVSEDDGPYGEEAFEVEVAGLDPFTTYYFRAFAVNTEGTGFSDEASFMTAPDYPEGTVVIDFEGDGETTGDIYNVGTRTLSGYDFDFTSVMIGTDASDWKNGERSARIRGYGNSALTMLEDLTNGLGLIEFSYSRYGTDSQESLVVEYSTTAGANWMSIGDPFTADDTVQTFSEVVDVGGNVRIRFRMENTELSDSNRRMNIDDIAMTPSDEPPSVIPPTVVSPTATDIDGVTATLGGDLIDVGDSTVVERGIYWSVTQSFDPRLDGHKVSEFGSFVEGVFTMAVTNLAPNETIYYRAFALNAAGEGFSSDKSFQTGFSVPIVEVPPATDISDVSAMLGGTITSDGGHDITERGVIYSDNPDFDPELEGTPVSETGTFGEGAFALAVTGLDAATEYTFVAFAVNAEGTAYSVKSAFETWPPPPSDLLAYFAFTGDSESPSYTAAGVNATDFDVSAGSISLTFATAAEDWEALGGAEPYAQGSGGWAEDDQESAKHFFIELSAEPGETMTITNISYLHRRTAEGPDTAGVSIDGASIFVGDLPSVTVVPVSIPVTEYVDITNAVIRFSGWGDTTGGGLYQIDNVLVQGTVSGEPGPDPQPVEVTFTVTAGDPAAVTFVGEACVWYALQFTTDLTDPDGWVYVLDEFDEPIQVEGDGVTPRTLSDEDPADELRVYRLVQTDAP